MATTNEQRVFGYCRVSSRNQQTQGSSLEGQRERIERWCAQNGLAEPTIVVEAESASEERTESRVQLHALVDRLQPGDVVVVVAQDRWSRSVSFHLKSLQDVARKGARFHSISEGIDFGAKENRFTTTILAAVAEQERMRIHERTVKRRSELQDSGFYACGMAPFGYVRGDRREKSQRNILRMVEPDASIARTIFERSAAGLAVHRIVLWLQQEHPNVRSWNSKLVLTILRSRVYTGMVKGSDGSWVEGRHEAIVSHDLFDAVQSGLAARRLCGRKPSRETEAARTVLLGFARCSHCNAPLNRCQSAPREGDEHVRLYYGCTQNGGRRTGCSEPWWVPFEPVDAELDRSVRSRFLELAACSPPDALDRSSLLKEGETIKARRESILDLVEAGAIDRHTVAGRLARIAEDERELERRLREHDRHDMARTRVVEFRERVAQLSEAWSIAEAFERRPILRLIAKGCSLSSEGRILTVWKETEGLLVELVG